MDYQALWTEISTDPLSRGYAGMTDAEIAESLNTADRTITRDTLGSAEIYEQIVVSEFQALTDGEKTLVRDILGLGGNIQVGPGTKARTVLINVFGAGSQTITDLAAALEQTVSRAAELDLPRIYVHDVATARERYGG